MLDLYKVFFIPFLFLLVLLPITLAVPPFSEDVLGTFTEGLIIDYPAFNYHQSYSYFELIVHVYNISTGSAMSNLSTSCEGHLYNATGEGVMHVPYASSHNGNPQEFVFAVTNSSILHNGYYGWSIHCNTSYLGGYASGNIILTETGKPAATQNTEDELFLYFVFLLAIILLFVSFYKEDHNLASISGMLMIILGGYIIATGFSTLTNGLSNGIGIVLIGVGFYILLRSNIENF